MPEIPNIQPDPLLPEYRWNSKAKRYINSSGDFVKFDTIRFELDKVLDDISLDMRKLSQSFRAGNIDGATLQREGMLLIKQAHLTGGALEKGGWFQMTQSDFGRVGQVVRGEYEFFRNMLKDIESGKQKLNGSLDARMALYGQMGRSTFHGFETETMIELGKVGESNILSGRDHCKDDIREGCPTQTAKGIVPIGTLVPIGRRTCLSNCRCRKQYYDAIPQ